MRYRCRIPCTASHVTDSLHAWYNIMSPTTPGDRCHSVLTPLHAANLLNITMHYTYKQSDNTPGRPASSHSPLQRVGLTGTMASPAISISVLHPSQPCALYHQHNCTRNRVSCARPHHRLPLIQPPPLCIYSTSSGSLMGILICACNSGALLDTPPGASSSTVMVPVPAIGSIAVTGTWKGEWAARAGACMSSCVWKRFVGVCKVNFGSAVNANTLNIVTLP